MPGWQNSNRRSQLPANWPAIRDAVFERDGWQCTERYSTGERCPETKGLECDHIRRGSDHSMANLRTLCEWHHQQKSSKEGAEALDRRRKQINQKFRRTEVHPARM